MNKIQIVLASGSPRRKELLKLICQDFITYKPDCEEKYPPDLDPLSVPEYLSKQKCLCRTKAFENSIVISADTAVILKNKILGKPENESHAFSMLKELSGKLHTVVTGVTLGYRDLFCSFSVNTNVKFYDLSDREIKNYILTGEPFDKAGAYGIQGKGALLAEKIEGDYFNVVGLPVSRLNRELQKFINSIQSK